MELSPSSPVAEAQRRQRWNVRLTFTSSFLSELTKSIWSSATMSSYIFIVTGRESAVGLATGIQGLAQMAAAPLGALISDKGGRVTALRLGGAAGLASAAATAAAVVHGSHYGALCAALAAWGVTWGISDPSVEALFADSVPRGRRSHIYVLKYVATLVASAAGPLISIALFLRLGDAWTASACATTICVGVALATVPCALLFAFREPTVSARRGGGGAGPLLTSDDLAAPLLAQPATAVVGAADPEKDDVASVLSDVSIGTGTGGGSVEVQLGGGGSKWWGPRRQRRRRPLRSCDGADSSSGGGCGSWLAGAEVPAAVALSDFLTNIASGMSIRYFPIFFMNDVGLSPVAVSAIWATAPLVTAAAAAATQRMLAPWAGRAVATMAVKIVGVSLLVLICAMRRAGAGSAGGASQVALVLVYLARTALMNCSKPLTRSIIMDTVPPSQRARWSALESLSTAGWSGSAMLGGLLVERCGMLTNFVTTAALQAAALAPLLYVARNEPHEHHHGPCDEGSAVCKAVEAAATAVAAEVADEEGVATAGTRLAAVL